MAAIAFALGVRSPWTLVTLAFAGFTAFVTLRELALPLVRRMRAHGEGFGQALMESQVRRGHRRTGAYVVHAGAVIAFAAPSRARWRRSGSSLGCPGPTRAGPAGASGSTREARSS